MVILEFQEDKDIIAEDRKTNIRSVDPGVLQQTYFTLPVRFCINDVELLEFVEASGKQSSEYISIPLLNIAVIGLEKVRSARKKSVEIYSLPGSGMRVSFTKVGEDIIVHSYINGKEVSVSYAELIKEFEEFVVSVKNYLNKTVPELNDNLWWKKWISDTA